MSNKITDSEEKRIISNKLIIPASHEDITKGKQKTQLVNSQGNTLGITDNALDVNIINPTLVLAEPITIDATNLDVRDLTFATDKIDASGSILGASTNNIGDVDIASIVGTVSTLNSSTTLLGAAGVFTGTSEEIKNYGMISISVSSDVASAASGLSIQFSPDGTNWDFVLNHTVTVATPKVLHVVPNGRYFRIVYTNDGFAQASFRLQTIFRSISIGGAVISIEDDNFDGYKLAQIVRSVLVAKKPAGAGYANVTSTASGNLKVSVEEAIAIPTGTNTIGAVNQITGQGRTLLFGAISQAVAGTTQLVAADATKKIKVCSYTFIMSLAGTTKFISGAGDLTGVMTFATNGGAVCAGQPSSHILETPVNSALSIVSTVGACNGHFTYFLEA